MSDKVYFILWNMEVKHDLTRYFYFSQDESAQIYHQECVEKTVISK